MHLSRFARSGTIGTFAVNNNLTLAGKLLVEVTASANDTVTAGGSITLSARATLEIVNNSLLERERPREPFCVPQIDFV